MNDNDLTPQAASLTAVFSNSPATPAPARTPTAAPTTPPPPVEPHSKNGLSDAEAATMAEWARKDLAAGKISSAQAEKIFTHLSTPAEQRLPDTRTDEQKLLDKQFPPAKETDYTIRYGELGQEMVMTPELKQFDATARAWMSGAGLPRELGNTLVDTIAKVAQTTKAMTPEQLIGYGETEFVKLQQAYGQALEEKLQAAAEMIHDLDLKQPGLKNLLRSKGIGDSAMVVSLLIQQARIFHARQGR